MNLDAWLTTNGVPTERFARIVGCGRSTIVRLRRGGRATYPTAKNIVEATGGEVSLIRLLEGGSVSEEPPESMRGTDRKRL